MLVLRRLVIARPSLVIVPFVVFFATALLPGDAVPVSLFQDISAATLPGSPCDQAISAWKMSLTSLLGFMVARSQADWTTFSNPPN